MNQNRESENADHAEGCMFPTGPDGQVCRHPVAKNGKPVGGRRPLYCDDPEHTRGKAFALRRRYELAAARGQSSNRQGVLQIEVSERPVTDGHVSFSALVTRFEQASTQLATILERAMEVVRTVSDPDAAGYEVEQTQREAAIQVAQAQGSQDDS